MSQHNLISIDLAKNVFQVCGMTDRQAVVFNRQLKRKDLVAFMINQAPVEVAMKACYSSHYWGRCFETMGHQVKLIPAQHVAPFVRGNKSDHNDAIAIGEAARRPNLIPVPIKTIEQSDIQCIHRMRERYVRDKTGLTNQTRGLLSEYGVIGAAGHKAFSTLIREVSAPEYEGLSPLLKDQLNSVSDEYCYQNLRIQEYNRILSEMAHQHPLCQILLSIPGIGPINATAIYSAIGNGAQFNSGRQFSVWMGLTPRQASSGDQFSSGGITKRGNRYLRKQLVHGARAVLFRSKDKKDPLNLWAHSVAERRGVPKASVALAARLARLAWTLMQRNTMYQPRF
jgi:transposase